MKTIKIQTKTARTVARTYGLNYKDFVNACANGLVKGAVYNNETHHWHVPCPVVLHFQAARPH